MCACVREIEKDKKTDRRGEGERAVRYVHNYKRVFFGAYTTSHNARKTFSKSLATLYSCDYLIVLQ